MAEETSAGIQDHPNIREYERHPLSAYFGDIPDDEYAEMLVHAKEYPTREMIALYEGKILDGWHRYRMFLDGDGIIPEPFPFEMSSHDPVAYVLGRNLFRRHLNASQRASIVSACYKWAGRGGQVESLPSNDSVRTTAQMAEEANVSTQTVTDARTAERGGYGDAVRSGEMSAKAAATEVRQQEREGYEGQQPGTSDSPPAPEQPSAAPAPEGETTTDDAGYEPGDDAALDDEPGTKPPEPEWARIKMVDLRALEESKYKLVQDMDAAVEKIAMLEEQNSPDPETSQVVTNQRSLIRVQEATIRSLTEERNDLQGVVGRQRAYRKKLESVLEENGFNLERVLK